MSDPLRVFISYRRSDCLAQANALNDGLKNRLKDVKVFMDMDSIPPGVDFERHIRREIAQTHIVLVMIGDNWLDVGPTGVRRIDEPNDFVRLEIESTLAEESTRLIPVLVEGASMPAPGELPASIARLARFNAIELSDQRWSQDIQRMAETIDRVRQELLGSSGPAAPGVAPPPYVPPRPAAPSSPSWSPPPPSQTSRPTFSPQQTRPAAPPQDQRWKPTQPASPSMPSASSNAALVAALPFAATCCSCGLLAPVVTGWLASKHKHSPRTRKRLLQWTGALTAALVVGLVMVGVAPVDKEGTPTGAAANVGAGLYFLVMLVTLVLVWMYRSQSDPPTGAAAGLERREAREQYRDLVKNDPALARSIHVGRPDLVRDYDDGGLVDLNSIPIGWLEARSGLSAVDVSAIAAAREQMGGAFSSVDELLAFSSSTSPQLTQWVREYAVTM